MSAIDIRHIMDILPHRYPFLLIDRILELEPMKRALGYKNVTVNEEFFQGHFPGNPLMPGVLIVEALAQLGGAVILNPGEYQHKTTFLVGIDKVKFRRPVVPGDQLMMEATIVQARQNIGWVTAVARVDGKLVCSGTLTFTVTQAPESPAMDAAILHG